MQISRITRIPAVLTMSFWDRLEESAGSLVPSHSDFDSLSCRNASVVASVVGALFSGSSMSDEMECGGMYYRAVTATCSGTVVRDLCVSKGINGCHDESVICNSTESNQHSVLHVSPCIMNALMPRPTDVAERMAGWTYLVAFAFNDQLPAPPVTNVTVFSSRETLTIHASVNASISGGKLFCAAVSGNGSILISDMAAATALQAKMLSDLATPFVNFALSSSLTHLELTLGGLVPATEYSVLCMTVSSKGTALSPQNMLALHETTETLCCREIILELAVPRTRSKVLEDAAVSLISPFGRMEEEGGVIVDVTTSGENSDQVQVLMPKALTLPEATKDVFFTYFRFLSNGVGDFTLQPRLIGRDKHRYRIVWADDPAASKGGLVSASLPEVPAPRVITVEDTVVEPPTPSILSAMFSSSGMSVVVAFDADTDKGTSTGVAPVFPCSIMFTFVSAETASCRWRSSREIVIEKSTISPLESLIFKSGLLQARCPSSVDCADWALNIAGNVIVNEPASPVLPVVQLRLTPSVALSDCQPLTVDMGGSSGSGGGCLVFARRGLAALLQGSTQVVRPPGPRAGRQATQAHCQDRSRSRPLSSRSSHRSRP